MNDATDRHLSAEQLQAFLDGEVPGRDRSRVEEHLASCVRCSAELDAWRTLFADLEDLTPHRPLEGFADRVMADVDVPAALPWAAQVRAGARALVPDRNEHVAPDRLQDFLDGALAARQAVRVERHLNACARCTAEADAWLSVMHRLGALERFAPSEHFRESVMAGVQVPEPLSWASGLRTRLAAFLGRSTPEHLPAGILQDLVDGTLSASVVARIRRHLDACGSCSDELEAWRTVAARLGQLERFAPADGFADAVMDELALRPAAARVPARVRASQRLLAAARRLVPQSREAWAALSGVAVTPAVVAGLMVWAVFSHPTLTLGSLASFLWWQVTDGMGAFAAVLGSAALQGAESFGVYALFEMASSAPAAVAAGALTYTMICALALRVLYKNLFSNRPARGRIAHVQTAS